MYNQFKYIASFFDLKIKNRFGQRGAEMVEYAIVLACIAAVAAIFYATNGTSADSLNKILTALWGKVRSNLSGVL